MAPKAEKKPAEKKPVTEKTPAEKKPKADKKLPKDATSTGADKKKKRTKKSVETYKIYIFMVLKQVHPDIGISSKAIGIMNSFINDIFEKLASESSRLASPSVSNFTMLLKSRWRLRTEPNPLRKMMLGTKAIRPTDLPYCNDVKDCALPYDCRVTIRSKLKMIPKIKERISSSKWRLDFFKNTVFEKWLDLDDKDYDNHLLNYVLHHQRPDLSKSIYSNILFDIAGRTLLLGRAEFCLTRVSGQIEKARKEKASLGKAAKAKAAQPSDKGDKDSVTIGDLGELVQDKATKGKAAQPSDKGDKDCDDWRPRIQIQLLSFNRLIQRWGRKLYDYLEVKEKSVQIADLGGFTHDDGSNSYIGKDGRGATDGAKVSGEAMKDADMNAVAQLEKT
nr:histone H2B.3 [Tanacetum cinerariifolium]